MIELKIDPEFESLIPPLSDEEFQQLKDNIISEGRVRDALIVWNGIILDGHNRWKIVQENPDIPFSTEEMSFTTRNEATAWMIRNQLGRRNLTNYDRAKLALRLKPILVEEAKKRQAATQFGSSTVVPISAPPQKSKVRDELAKIAGVGHDTIEKVQVIENSATPEEKEKLSKGEVSVNKVFTSIRDRENPNSGFTKERREKKKLIDAVIADMYSPEVKPFTIEMLEEEIEINGKNYIDLLRGQLVERSTLLVGDNRPRVVSKIDFIVSEIQKIRGLVT